MGGGGQKDNAEMYLRGSMTRMTGRDPIASSSRTWTKTFFCWFLMANNPHLLRASGFTRFERPTSGQQIRR